jgi:hypothetical protein
MNGLVFFTDPRSVQNPRLKSARSGGWIRVIGMRALIWFTFNEDSTMRGSIIPAAVGMVSATCGLLLASACARGGPAYTDTVQNGVRVREYTTAVPPRVDPYAVVPDVVFGTDQGENTYFFVGSPTPVGVLHDGGLLVRSRLVYRFSADGNYLGTIGRSGRGPGEYGLTSSLIVDGSRLYIYDLTARRRTIFDLEGNVLDMTPMPPEWSPSSPRRPTAFT